eukprot:856708-Rhodomonas_salina.1
MAWLWLKHAATSLAERNTAPRIIHPALLHATLNFRLRLESLRHQVMFSLERRDTGFCSEDHVSSGRPGFPD